MRMVLLAMAIQIAFFSNAVATESQSQKNQKQTTAAQKALDTPTQIRAEASDSSSITEISRLGNVSLSTTARRLPENGVVLSDDHGGWRLEKYFPSGELRSVQDTVGMVVDVIREANGRPVGILFGKDLALEYTYSDRSGVWERKLLYNLNTRELLAEVINEQTAGERPAAVFGHIQSQLHRPKTTEVSCLGPSAVRAETFGERWFLVTCVEGQRYAMLPVDGDGRVIRSVVVAGPPETAIEERIDYTDSELVIRITTGDPGRTVVVALARESQDTRTPIMIENNEPEISKYLAVLATGKPSTALSAAEPALNGSLSSSVTTTLLHAFPLALDKVRQNRACLALFEPYLVSGIERLESTFYAPPSAEHTNDVCGENTLAYTHVGSPVTHLCSNFGTISREHAAIVLIHEALHFAGLPEAPGYPDALTSQEIHGLVIDSCGF